MTSFYAMMNVYQLLVNSTTYHSLKVKIISSNRMIGSEACFHLICHLKSGIDKASL